MEINYREHAAFLISILYKPIPLNLLQRLIHHRVKQESNS